MQRFMFPGALLVILAMVTASTAGAQEATPDAIPIAPDPAECQVAPRTVDVLVVLVATPAAGAATPLAGSATAADLTGEPADAETVAAVTATVREIVACGNAGESFAVLALYTDGLVRRLVPPDAEALANAAAIPATPRATLNRLAMAAVRDVQMLPDSRVSAIVEVGAIAALDTVTPDRLIFALENGRYRVDEVIAGGAAGTPAPSS